MMAPKTIDILRVTLEVAEAEQNWQRVADVRRFLERQYGEERCLQDLADWCDEQLALRCGLRTAA